MRLFLLFFLLILSTGQTGYAQEASIELRLAGPDFAPYYELDQNQKLSGHLVRLFGLIAGNAGYSWQGDLMPAKRVFAALKQGKYNATIIVKNPFFDKVRDVIVSPKPVSYMILNVYGRQGNMHVQNRADLKGQKVAIIRGYGYGGMRTWLENPAHAITLHEVDSFASAFRLLESGRVDYALLYDVNLQAAEHSLGRKIPDIDYITLTEVPLYIHLNIKTLKSANLIMKRLMNSYDDLVQKGILIDGELPERILQR